MIRNPIPAEDQLTDGGRYARRLDETEKSISTKAAGVIKQLFDPEQYSDYQREEKKDLYIFLDRELFCYTDAIEIKAEKGAEYSLEPELTKDEDVLFRFAAAYFFHCMLNWKINEVKSDHYRLAGSGPDSFLLNVLTDTANRCCAEHPNQTWLKGSSFVTEEGEYAEYSFRNTEESFRKKIYEIASSSEFVFREPSGSFEYRWKGKHFRNDYLCISISILSPQHRYYDYPSMIDGILKNWMTKYMEVFGENIESMNLNKDTDFEISESYFMKSMGLKGKNNNSTKRYPSDLELQLFTLAAGEDRKTYDRLKTLRDRYYHVNDTARPGGSLEKQELEETLNLYLEQGPERFSNACQQLKVFLETGKTENMKSLIMTRYRMLYPNISRMIMIITAVNRYTDKLSDIRSQYSGFRLQQEHRKFLNAFSATEVTKLQLITEEEVKQLIDSGYTLSADKNDLKELLEKIKEDAPKKAKRDSN